MRNEKNYFRRAYNRKFKFDVIFNSGKSERT